MITNTIDDLSHPQILKTAKMLAWHQVNLGICRHQDHEDLVQDLLLFLCKQFRRFTGKVPFVNWACQELRSHVAAINHRFFGIPWPKAKAKRAQATASVASESPTPTPNPVTVALESPAATPSPVTVAPVSPEQNPPTQNQERTAATNPITAPHAATNPAKGQHQQKTTPPARRENVQGAQDSGAWAKESQQRPQDSGAWAKGSQQRPQDSGAWAKESQQPKAGGVRKLLQGFWVKLSSWVQGPQRDRTPQPPETNPKSSRDNLLNKTKKETS